MNLKELLENNEDWKALSIKEKRSQLYSYYSKLMTSGMTDKQKRERALAGVQGRIEKYGQKGWKRDKETGKYNLGKAFASNIIKNK